MLHRSDGFQRFSFSLFSNQMHKSLREGGSKMVLMLREKGKGFKKDDEFDLNGFVLCYGGFG